MKQDMNEVNPPIISVRNLKTYFFQDEGTVKAVDGASLDVYLGKTLGIVGESGCGKTVTAKSILRIVEKPGKILQGEVLLRTRPDSCGDHESKEMLEWNEVDLTKLDPNGRAIREIRGSEIALIFQEPMTSLSPVHTIGNQLMEACKLHREVSEKEAQKIATEVLKSVEIPRAEGRLREYPFQLSGGLRQRAMIAMALTCNPNILIADEPTTSVDVTTQAQILDLMKSIQKERGMAIILITHNMGVIAEMADDVVVMYLGRVVEKGSVDDIFHTPKHPYTKALLSSIPSVIGQPREILPTISGSIPHPYNRPPGCPFHPRCAEFIPGVCDKYEPPLKKMNHDREVSCFLYQDPVIDEKT